MITCFYRLVRSPPYFMARIKDKPADQLVIAHLLQSYSVLAAQPQESPMVRFGTPCNHPLKPALDITVIIFFSSLFFLVLKALLWSFPYYSRQLLLLRLRLRLRLRHTSPDWGQAKAPMSLCARLTIVDWRGVWRVLRYQA
jgi:hypothetical protein